MHAIKRANGETGRRWEVKVFEGENVLHCANRAYRLGEPQIAPISAGFFARFNLGAICAVLCGFNSF
jgi:hypothetical protein